MGNDFVEDWSIVSTLGEGAFGEVKLLMNKTNGDMVAMKMIDLEKHPQAASNVQKEVLIHRMIKDPHIIRYFGQRKEGKREYIFLEYAAGGELFDRIEPDVGMSEFHAQKYMRQLVLGVQYLHSRGIAHRDLKPENLLLDADDNLKITDFGMATIFRTRDKERLLDTKCGTLPYVAPEVLNGSYAAQPVDVWSCGIILIAMLSGELPWDKPTMECPEYHKFRIDKYPSINPWTKLDNIALSLVYSMLNEVVKSRATLSQVLNHRWMHQEFNPYGLKSKHGSLVANNNNDDQKKLPVKRKFSSDEADSDNIDKKRKNENDDQIDGDLSRICQSQPESHAKLTTCTANLKTTEPDAFWFSQPTHLEDLLLNTQLQFTQSPVASQDQFQSLVKRMTRFFVTTDSKTAMQNICSQLEKLSCTWNLNSVGLLTITTTDSRNMQLVFKAHALEMDGKILVDFRLSKGCGLEFKRHFVKLKQGLSHIIQKSNCTSLKLPE